MLGGDENTILTVLAAVTNKSLMPVVVFPGSGQAADLLSFAVR